MANKKNNTATLDASTGYYVKRHNGKKMKLHRIDVRLADEKGKKKRLEQLVRGATLHINGCQSLMKNWGDEAKGMR